MSAPWYGHFGSCDIFPLVPLSVLESVLEQIVLKYDKKVNNDCSHFGILDELGITLLVKFELEKMSPVYPPKTSMLFSKTTAE
jgi:hypothetical protein